MQRWTSVTLALLLVGFVSVLVVKARPEPKAAPVPAPSTDAPTTEKPAESPAIGDAGVDGNSSAGEDLPRSLELRPLPDDAPKAIRFGVVLVRYQGAEFAPKDAPPKAAALERAKALLQQARENFDEAVKKGDPGSTADAGRIPRGVLEPPVEYVLFTLDKGQVYEAPLDTPRGYWIVRRTD